MVLTCGLWIGVLWLFSVGFNLLVCVRIYAVICLLFYLILFYVITLDYNWVWGCGCFRVCGFGLLYGWDEVISLVSR